MEFIFRYTSIIKYMKFDFSILKSTRPFIEKNIINLKQMYRIKFLKQLFLSLCMRITFVIYFRSNYHCRRLLKIISCVRFCMTFWIKNVCFFSPCFFLVQDIADPFFAYCKQHADRLDRKWKRKNYLALQSYCKMSLQEREKQLSPEAQVWNLCQTHFMCVCQYHVKYSYKIWLVIQEVDCH